ncbi:MAG: efflux RND transporter periplasmic adaptor subunit [Tolumonas sp.]|nr:efflux RND transporter periplasmic adaptor subunit [Tolumonas sp.]
MLSWRKVVGSLVLLLCITAGIFYLQKPPSVMVIHPTRGQAIEAVYATGTVESSITIRIAAERAARLIALLADEGIAVKTGQPLARFDDAELQANLQEMRIRQRNAEQHVSRMEKLYQRGATSIELLEQARADADAARAVTQRFQAQVNSLTLISPVDGEIIRRDGEVGDYIPVNQPVFYLRKTNTPLRLVVDVDEEDIPAVKPAQPVLITTDAFSGQVFHATVSDITPKGDAVTRSYRVRVILPASVPFLIGMTAEANIITAQRDNALLIPNSALINNSVWLFKAGKAVQQPVKIGAKNTDKTEITEGLSEQDLLIVDPPLSLKANQPVNAKLPEKAGAQS